MVGLPGTGLGGIFYFLLILWMPVREAFASRQAHRWLRWRQIGWLGGLVAAMVGALWLEGWVLQRLLPNELPSGSGSQHGDWSSTVDALTPAFAVAPFAILAVLLLGLHVARLLLRPEPTVLKRDHQPMMAGRPSETATIG